MLAAALFLALCVICVPAAARLVRAGWPRRAPSSAILLWQALGLAWGLSAIGAVLAVALAPYRQGVALGLVALARSGADLGKIGVVHVAALAGACLLTAVLLGALVVSLARTAAARRRHRALLAVLADGHPDVPGTLIVDHPSAAAYCVPGVRSRLVVSAGTLRLLGREELRAVIAHERAHARERHDLVVLPFSSLLRLFPRSRLVREAVNAVSLLVEMRADDRAAREQPRRQLAMALLRFGTAQPVAAPDGALGVVAGGSTESAVATRALRLLGPSPRLPRHVRFATWSATGALAALPLLLALLPSWP